MLMSKLCLQSDSRRGTAATAKQHQKLHALRCCSHAPAGSGVEARGQSFTPHMRSSELPFIRLFFCNDLTLLFYMRVFLLYFRGTFVRKFAKIRFADGYRQRLRAYSFAKAPMFEPQNS
jgi:hypothetical protein